MNLDYTRDKEFLRQLFNNKTQEKYVRLLLLDFQERPIETIEGKVKNEGSLNLDGSSAVRRTCSLSFILDSTELLGYNWSVKSKFQLFIGLKNHVDTINYPDIIWFKQGIFVITSLNQQIQNNNSTITIQGKDKMCLLNGELGGHLGIPVDFGCTQDEQGNKKSILLKNIILNLLRNYAYELPQNIIINDVPDYGLELIQYCGSDPFYMCGISTADPVAGIAPSIDSFNIIGSDLKTTIYKHIQNFYSLSPFANNFNADYVKTTNDSGFDEYHYVLELKYGDVMGYRPTELIFPGWDDGGLQVQATDHIQTVLDKIIQMFPSYEYFYDINGHFVFQEKRTYVNTSFSPLSYDDIGGADFYNSKSAYTWEYLDGELFTAFQNSPNIANLKNDFSAWGTKDSISGKKSSMHYRYIIGKKPTSYIRTDTQEEFLASNVDWRELIWQMADDSMKNNGQGLAFYTKLQQLNPWATSCFTGYETLYPDMLAFWRDIYHYNSITKRGEWDNEVLINPENLLFWLEFSEKGSAMNEYGVDQIGHRTKVINDTDAKSIMFRDIINAIFINPKDKDKMDKIFIASDYSKIIWPEPFNRWIKAAPGQKSLKNSIDSAVYNYTYCTTNVTISAAPNYAIEPNTIIYIADNINKIFGEYIVNKISLPLTASGTMTINAIKKEDLIY